MNTARAKVRTYKQSCVPIWFPEKFGEPYPPLSGTDEALEQFVAPAFAVGVRLEKNDDISVVAPFWLEDALGMTIRPNPNRPLAKDWDRVIERAIARWPELTILRA